MQRLIRPGGGQSCLVAPAWDLELWTHESSGSGGGRTYVSPFGLGGRLLKDGLHSLTNTTPCKTRARARLQDAQTAVNVLRLIEELQNTFKIPRRTTTQKQKGWQIYTQVHIFSKSTCLSTHSTLNLIIKYLTPPWPLTQTSWLTCAVYTSCCVSECFCTQSSPNSLWMIWVQLESWDSSKEPKLIHEKESEIITSWNLRRRITHVDFTSVNDIWLYVFIDFY